MADTKDARIPKAKFCTQCGVKLEEAHKFCWNCGHPRAGGAPAEEPVWETCTIAYKAYKDGLLLLGFPGEAKWLAKATGPNGSYQADESPPFMARVHKGVVQIPVGGDLWYAEALQALDELASKLVADGWEPTGSYGGSYWSKQYRRRIG